MSNQKQNNISSLTRQKAGMLLKTGECIPTTLQFHFWGLGNLYLGPFQTMVAGSCSKVVILVQRPFV